MSRNRDAIRFADDLIEAAVQRLAAVDRELAALQRLSRRQSTVEIREQTAVVRARRDALHLELLDLIALAELPVELMGSA